MIGGNMRARQLLAAAPIRAINTSKCGITDPKPTEMQNKFATFSKYVKQCAGNSY